MKFLLSSLLLMITFLPLKGQDLQMDTPPSLQKYVGYYHVGIKAGHPFFYARAFIRKENLVIIFDGDTGNELVWRTGHTFFGKGDTLYQYGLTFREVNGVITDFKLYRPRSKWPTDLFGYRVEGWDKYAVDTEQELQKIHSSPHFTFHYPINDSANVLKLARHLEDCYQETLSWFKLDTLPVISIRIYQDLITYHNAVLTPEAPDWQMGRAWTKDEIRMVSLKGVPFDQYQPFSFEQAVQHEFVHCIHWNITNNTRNTPGWLWEGVAMYKGCCGWQNLKNLSFLKEKEYPSLNRIEADNSFELKYQLGYYLIEFVDQTWGREKVLKLIQSDGNISTTLNLTKKQFEKRFYTFLEEVYLQ